MSFMNHNIEDHFDKLIIHFYDNNNSRYNIESKTLYRVSSIRYLGLMFDKHLRWNFACSFYKLRKIVPINANYLNNINNIIPNINSIIL